MENGDAVLNLEFLNAVAATLKDANFGPWQLIVLVFGGVFLWNAPKLYRIHVDKYERRRKWDYMDEKLNRKLVEDDERRERRAKPQLSSEKRKASR